MGECKNSMRIIGIANIIGGICLGIVLLLLQGIFAFIVGAVFVAFGISVLAGKPHFKLLFYGMVPLTIVFSLMVIMLGISENVPEYYKTPPMVGIILILPFLSICVTNVLFFNHLRVKGNFKKTCVSSLKNKKVK